MANAADTLRQYEVFVQEPVEVKPKPRKMTDAERRAKIKRVAREHGAALGEKAFDAALAKIARHKPPASDGNKR